MGIATEFLTFPMAHEACAEEIAATARFLREVLPEGGEECAAGAAGTAGAADAAGVPKDGAAAPTADDLSTWDTKRLKGFVEARGGSAAGCLYKSELLAIAKSLL